MDVGAARRGRARNPAATSCASSSTKRPAALYALKELPAPHRAARIRAAAGPRGRGDARRRGGRRGHRARRGARRGPDHPPPRVLAAVPHAVRARRRRRTCATRCSTRSRSCSSGSTSAGSSGATARSRTRSSAATPARSRPTSSTPRPASCSPALATASASTTSTIAEENVVGELLDVEAELGARGRASTRWRRRRGGRAPLREPLGRADPRGGVRPRRALQDRRAAATAQRARLRRRGDRARRGAEDGYRLRLDPRVVEPGHHRRRLRVLTGLDAQENQARRLLNDLARYRATLERARRGRHARDGRRVPLARRGLRAGGRRGPAGAARQARRRRGLPRDRSSTAGSSPSRRARTSG